MENNSKKKTKDKKQRKRKRNRQNNSEVLTGNCKFKKDNYAEAKDYSQFGTYEDLSPISNIEDAKLRHVHSSRTVASLHENLPEHSGNSKFKKENYAEAKDYSQFGTYEDLSPISNIEDAKLRHVHSSRTVASLHENLPEHSGNSKFKKENYAEAKDYSQFGTYEDLSPISNIEDAKLRHVHSSRTVASLHENLPEHSGNSKFKKENYAEAKDYSQFGTYEDLSPISNIEDAKLRHVHSSRTVASLHENLPEHSGNSKFKKENYAEAKDYSQFGTYEDLSPISNIEDAKLRHVHSSRTVASLHENLPEHSGNSKFKKENYAEAKDYSQFGTYEDLSPISNIEDAKLRHVHSSRTVASLHENLPEHSGNSKFKKENYAEAKDYSQFGTYEDLSPISNIEDAKLRHVHSSRTVASLHENLPEHSGNSKFKKENYAEAKDYSQFGTYEDLSPISNIEDAKLRHVHSSRTVASLHENLPEHSGNSKFKKENYAEAKDYSQFGTYEDLSPISNIEDAKLRHVHSSRTVASLHENLPEHSGNSKFKKENYAEAKDYSQFGTYEDLSPISNIEDAKLRHVHSSRTVASLHENLPEHSGNSKFKKENYAEAKDYSQFGTYEDLSPISNIEDAKLRHVHSSRTVASLHENLPEHSGNSKFKKENYAEAKYYSQFGTYEDLSPISNIEDVKLRHVHSSRTVASLHENLPEHSGNSKFKKGNYAEAKDYSQFGTYEDLSPISNIEDAKLRHVHSSRTVASLHENLPEHSGNSKFKKENYAEAKDYSQFGTYEDLSPISNIEDAKLRHVHSSRTVASLHENLPEHSGNSKFKKENYAEAKYYSQFGTYEDLSPISNIEDVKLRHVHSSRTVASLHENLPEHSGNSKFKKGNYAEAKDYSQFGTYEDLSPISNIEDAKLRHVHSSRTVASLHENLPEHSGNSKFKKENYAEAKYYSQFGTYEDLSPISNIEDAKLRHVHSSRTVASLHENLPEHSGNSKFKKENYAEAKY